MNVGHEVFWGLAGGVLATEPVCENVWGPVEEMGETGKGVWGGEPVRDCKGATKGHVFVLAELGGG